MDINHFAAWYMGKVGRKMTLGEARFVESYIGDGLINPDKTGARNKDRLRGMVREYFQGMHWKE